MPQVRGTVDGGAWRSRERSSTHLLWRDQTSEVRWQVRGQRRSDFRIQAANSACAGKADTECSPATCSNINLTSPPATTWAGSRNEAARPWLSRTAWKRRRPGRPGSATTARPPRPRISMQRRASASANCGVYATSDATSQSAGGSGAGPHRSKVQVCSCSACSCADWRSSASPASSWSLAITRADEAAASASEHSPVPQPTSSTVKGGGIGVEPAGQDDR